MSTPTMLYKHPGKHEIHGDKFDYTIVDADDAMVLTAALDEGWFFTTTDAKNASQKPSEKTTLSAEYLENVTDSPKRGRPKKVAEVESIPDSI